MIQKHSHGIKKEVGFETEKIAFWYYSRICHWQWETFPVFDLHRKIAFLFCFFFLIKLIVIEYARHLVYKRQRKLFKFPSRFFCTFFLSNLFLHPIDVVRYFWLFIRLTKEKSIFSKYDDAITFSPFMYPLSYNKSFRKKSYSIGIYWNLSNFFPIVQFFSPW